MKSSKKLPGVGRYDLDKNYNKVHGTYTQKSPITGVVAEAQYNGMSSPSHYNSVDINLIKQKYRTARIYKPKAEKGDWKVVQNNSPSPVTYDFEKLKQMKRGLNCVINKSPKTNFTDIEIKNRKNSPGVGRYNPEEADRRITIGARRGYK